MSTQIQLNDPKTIRNWALFDWANSAYALVISTAIFPPFFEAVTTDQVSFLGGSISNTALYSFAISFSYFFMVLVNPILAGIADGGGKRKMFLRFFTLLGGVACISMFFFETSGYVWWATLGFVLATIGFQAGTVFYNAYLPEIVTEDKFDQVSAKGYAYGYIGSVILLIFILAMIQNPEFFGMKESTLQARIGFVLVGVWWIGFGLYSMNRLPKDSFKKTLIHPVKKGIQELKSAWSKIKANKHLMRFLASFFFYISGLNTIVYLATIFAKKVLNIGQSELIKTVLIIQLLGMVGAYLFAYVSKLKGNKLAIGIMITIWMILCIVGYFVNGTTGFYVLSGFVGLVVGGTQAVSRSAFAKMVEGHKAKMNSYFSILDVVRNLAVVAGTLVFGLVDQLTQNMRFSVLSVAVFFALGLVFLVITNLEEAKI